MSRLPIVLVHGYSDKGESYREWCSILRARGYDASTIHLANYVSLSNEITIKDIAEGFDRALRVRAGLSSDEPFDAIVHSTGMLVVREWLVSYAARSARLKHLIGLAPATFGSPMAHKGRSWLGAIFKGGKEPGPDFCEAGDQVLAGLELGSRYTWELAHRDLLGNGSEAVYGPTSRTPYPFILVGLKDYGWLKRAVTEPGTDGTVRWAGVGFNARKVIVDLTRDPARPARQPRVERTRWMNAEVPLAFLEDLNHSSILSDPTPRLVTMVEEALGVSSASAYTDWASRHAKLPEKVRHWQQFVVHAVDERGDGIRDYYVRVGRLREGKFRELPFDLDVHAFKDDPSFRCFHVDLDKLGADDSDSLAILVIAQSGTERVGYCGLNAGAAPMIPLEERAKWNAAVAFRPTIKDFSFFSPFTTTLVELKLNREPMPLEGVNQVLWFTDPPNA